MEQDQPRDDDGAAELGKSLVTVTATVTATQNTTHTAPGLLSTGLDVPPPVPPKDDLPLSRPGTAPTSTSTSTSTSATNDATLSGTKIGPKPGTAGTGRSATGPSIAGTMSTSRSRAHSRAHSRAQPSTSTLASSYFGPPAAPPPARELPPPPTLASLSRPSTAGVSSRPRHHTAGEEGEAPVPVPVPVQPLPQLPPPSNSKWDEARVTVEMALSRARSVTSAAGRKLSDSTSNMATGVKMKSKSCKAMWYGAEKEQEQEHQADGPTALVPQPSDDEEDPLNWPLWKKDLTLFALLTALATTSATKTILLPLASPLASHLAASPTSVAALTAAPLLFSTVAVHASVVASRLYGKRPVYIASLVLLLCGCAATASTSTRATYGGFLAARIVQGLGWGAFDALPLGSVYDLYFEHERRPRLALLDAVTAIATWGSPLFTGVAARDAGGEGNRAFAVPFQIATGFLAVSILLALFAAPETAFDRWFSGTGTGTTTASKSPAPSRRRSSVGTTSTRTTTTMTTRRIEFGHYCRVNVRVPTSETTRYYLDRINPVSDFRGYRDTRTLLQGPRAVITPTTLLLALLTLLPTSALWGLTHVTSTLFAPRRAAALDPAQVGSLLAAPFVLATASVLSFAALSDRLGLSPTAVSTSTMTARSLLAVTSAGTLLMMTGTLAFGLETHARAGVPGALSFPLLSVLLGFLAAGTYGLGGLVRPLSWRLARSKTANPHVCLRVVADMEAGVGCWRAFFAGIFVLGIANAVERSSSGVGRSAGEAAGVLVQGTRGLRAMVIGMSVAQAVIAAMVGAVWWRWDESVLRLDGRVLGLVDLSTLKRSRSFFDH
ncbi:MFS general substrate transporter [Sodiomyces alkalinus F11]|uniref:MFS general substrate transporter n=1 Tax=Sodiomyces alkalinus (strain CBS 110278 / VKM F-3762 / F11) TaxID=1314773 RepID=A0A3N2Q8E9_SODAK|nr:MFS general substrate transporter [Sodiomyces alkalinus F11]ROT43051.1 MFS general substrate transporter [Sodiomyces alkalinus F11]